MKGLGCKTDEKHLFVNDAVLSSIANNLAEMGVDVTPTEDMAVKMSAKHPEFQSKCVSCSGDLEDGPLEFIKDSEHLLIIFPEEIWMFISENLTNPADMTNFSNASPYFRHLMLEKRTLFLFPQVWSVFESRSHHQRKLKSSRNGKIMECTREAQQFTEVLKLRLVCQVWCEAIDKYYEIVAAEDDRCSCAFWLEHMFKEDEDEVTLPPFNPQEFLRHFDSTHDDTQRNPFLGRRCNIVFDEDEDHSVFGADILRVLRQYGNHIWYCDITIPCTYFSGREWYKQLGDLLRLLPNLKYLAIESEGTVRNTSWNQIRVLRRMVRNHPLPKLPHLNSMRLYLHTPVLNHLIHQNNHVNSLRIRRMDRHKYNYQVYKNELIRNPLQNLRTLEILYESAEEFQRLYFVNLPLEKLKLTLCWCEPNFIRWPRIFTLLGMKWGKTLTDLELELPVIVLPKDEKNKEQNILVDCSSYKLNLPKLKHLKVDMSFCLSSLDFILPAQNSLETLEIVLYHHLEDRRNKRYLQIVAEQKIQFVGWTSRLLESNIWELLPKLKVIEISDHDLCDGKVYTETREEWEKEMKNKSLKVSLNKE